MARRLRGKEQHEVALWVHAMERVMSDSSNDPFVQDLSLIHIWWGNSAWGNRVRHSFITA